nr:unnamed protein product [Callosobruchus chinensis]
MVLVFRLRRKFLKYKVLLIIFLFLISLLIWFGTLKVSQAGSREHCYSEEPVDVVYTWVNGSDPQFLKNLNLYTKEIRDNVDYSKQRFDDKYELKSLEKYAPWIRHVYIVTNGQIPYWLDLDYEKVTIITHEEIFRNPVNLPTFSSPAIESNLHRIPNLSKRFIYFNDDVFLASPTFREDFYTPNTGYLVYLAWMVPNCSPNCPWMYVSDGQCDKDCFRSECQMDGGDCDGKENAGEQTNSGVNQYDQRVKSNFYKLNYTTAHNVDQNISTSNFLNGFLSESTTAIPPHQPFKKWTLENLTKVVELHNKMVLRKDRLRRRMLRKRRIRRTFVGSSKATPPRLQETFPKEFKVTERNKVRRYDDVQFSFAYYYYLMSEQTEISIGEIFREFDTDMSGIVDHFEAILLNCSEKKVFPDVSTPEYERYIDSKLPTISEYLVESCPTLVRMLKDRFGSAHKYRFETISNAESKHVSFKIKFVCLNDNLDESKAAENELVRAILYDFYLSLFPQPSKFELSEDYRNKFLYMKDLNEWKLYRFKIKLFIIFLVSTVLWMSLYNIIKRRVCRIMDILLC